MDMENGNKNICFGWIWILTGVMLGATLGMWAFNGPMKSPTGDYTELSSRLLRLSHIAFIALGIINILYGLGQKGARLKGKVWKIGSNCMILGAILMPILLMGAAFLEPLKYLTAVPASLVMIALFIMVKAQIGVYREK